MLLSIHSITQTKQFVFLFQPLFFTPTIHVQTFPLTLLSAQNPLGYSPCRPCVAASKAVCPPDRNRRATIKRHLQTRITRNQPGTFLGEKVYRTVLPNCRKNRYCRSLGSESMVQKRNIPILAIFAMVYWCNLVSLTASAVRRPKRIAILPLKYLVFCVDLFRSNA